MKYSNELIIKQYNEGAVLKYLFFWGHQPSKDGSITKSCFSQWWLSEFTIDDVVYKTAEHYMMAEKARLFNDANMLDVILKSKHPHEAKKLGRKVKNFDAKIWDEHKYDIVKKGNYHKFFQDEALCTFLKSTGERIIVETSPVDKVWGIGLAADHKNVTNPNQWQGQNLLGYALMEVRDDLK